jgi:hypothetical protein
MSNLQDRLGAYRAPINSSGGYSLIVLLCLAGLLISAILAITLASDAVLTAWANPI